MTKMKKSPIVFLSLLFLFSIGIGWFLGWCLSETNNIENTEYFTEFNTALPTKLLDINGEVITEFVSDEKREIISYNKLPQNLIDALLTREDRIFFSHNGFSFKAVLRAVIGKLTGKSLGGGSTLTQQIAGTLFCYRRDMSIKRKIDELWWAIQMERRYSKNEILELYLNRIYFGGGTYGVNAASKYYFGHPATEITPAEAAILVIQLSNPAYYNPFEYPNRAMERQQDVLNSMVKEGYLTRAEADDSFNTYWANFDYTRTSSSAYTMRDDKAPWFSEYVRRELSTMLYGTEDIYTGGFTVNTTLNLTHQKAAEEIMADYIKAANRLYQRSSSSRQNEAFRTYVPLTELMSLVFNLPSPKVSEQRAETIALNEYTEKINPVIDVMSLMFGMESLKTGIVNKGNALIKQNAEKTTIEGTMVSVENGTGYINALVGGSKYDQENQFIRAVQAKVQPGSTFKPLYYSAAIDSRNFTMTTIISDTPVVFHKEDGTPYIPQNFKGEWEGNVQLWYALAHSMNVPSLKVLDGIGFDAAIKRTSALLGIPQNELAERHFDHVYPLGLGVCSVRPIEMARAFSIFANGGKETIPIAILTGEGKNVIVKLNPEKDVRRAQQKKGSAAQIISPQTAYIMDMMLERTVESGTLAYGADFDSTAYVINKRKGTGNKFRFTTDNGKSFYMPVAGKTGTTQNWADAWTVGFTPYYTAAFWFGFDQPGQSLGLSITGSTLAGVAWGDFMHIANDGLPYKNFPTPAEGIVRATVCSESGQILTPDCGDHRVTAYYLSGTEPTTVCEIHSNKTSSILTSIRLKEEQIQSGQSYGNVDVSPLQMPSLDFLNDNYTDTSTSPKTNSTPSDGTDTDGSTNNGDNQDGNWLLE